MKLELEIHVHNHFDSGSLALIKEIHCDTKQTKELVMALSAKMAAYVESTNAAFAAAAEALASHSASLANITADIQRLLAGGGEPSAEDSAALDLQLGKMNQLQADLQTASDNLKAASEVVPES